MREEYFEYIDKIENEKREKERKNTERAELEKNKIDNERRRAAYQYYTYRKFSLYGIVFLLSGLLIYSKRINPG